MNPASNLNLQFVTPPPPRRPAESAAPRRSLRLFNVKAALALGGGGMSMRVGWGGEDVMIEVGKGPAASPKILRGRRGARFMGSRSHRSPWSARSPRSRPLLAIQTEEMP